MIKKTVNYTDFNGVAQTEELYFNLTKMELVKLDTEFVGGLQQTIQTAVDNNDTKTIMDCIEKILIKGYGKKSDDGKRFIKSAEMAEEFKQSAAFDEVFYQIASNEDEASAFITGLMPADLMNQIPNQK